MKKRIVETDDGRFLVVEGGRDSVSVANAISRSPDPRFGGSLDEEEPPGFAPPARADNEQPLRLPSLNADYSGQEGAPPNKPHAQRDMDDGAPLGLPAMNFSTPQKKAKPKKPVKSGFVMTEKNDGALPLPRMKF